MSAVKAGWPFDIFTNPANHGVSDPSEHAQGGVSYTGDAVHARALRLEKLRKLRAAEGAEPTDILLAGETQIVANAPPHPPQEPRGEGAFRKSMIAEEAVDQIGVGILAYKGRDDVQRALESIHKHGGQKYFVLVFDNSDDADIEKWIVKAVPWVHYVHSPQNVGCANGRNRMAEIFGQRGIQRFVIQDQDVEWRRDVPALMGKVFDDYPDTGQVTLPLALKQMGGHKWDVTGALTPPETPGMCCMYSLKAVADVGGWEESMFMYRFDTLFSLLANHAGYRIRIPLDADGAVAHNHPHSGIMRYPHWRREQIRSMRIFLEVMKKRGVPIPPRFGHG